MRRSVVLPALFASAFLAACSGAQILDTAGPGVQGTGVTAVAVDQRYEADTLVLESPQHGPQLCLGGVNDSLPPQCGGPDVAGWDWGAVEGEESFASTTWGSYRRVMGTYIDGVFTLTEPAGPPDPSPPGDSFGTDFATPCPAPDGGWIVLDPATTTSAGEQAAMAYALSQAGYAGLWVDQPINGALTDGLQPGDDEMANDPAKLVLNVRFTDDLQRHTDELRARWGGALCVSLAERTEAELASIQAELRYLPELLGSTTDVVTNQVLLHVAIDDGVQQRLDARYGNDAIRVTAALRPAD